MSRDTNQTASAIAYAALSAIEAGKDRVQLVNAIATSRLESLEQQALWNRGQATTPINPDELLLMIAEIKQGRTTR